MIILYMNEMIFMQRQLKNLSDNIVRFFFAVMETMTKQTKCHRLLQYRGLVDTSLL